MNKLAFSISQSGATFVIIVMVMVIVVIVVLLASMGKNKKKDNERENERQREVYTPQPTTKQVKKKAPPKQPRQPENISVHAVLVEKSDERKKSVNVDGSTTISGENYEVTFNLKDGGRKRFEVSRRVFKDIQLGERGMLVFNRDGFIKFKTQNGVIED